MLFDLDLMKGRTSPKYKSVAKSFNVLDLDFETAWELAVLLKTPGFLFKHHSTVFRWDKKTRLEMIPQVISYFESDLTVEAAAQDNYHNLTEEDAENYLRVLLYVRPNWDQIVPLVCWYLLRTLRASGLSRQELVKRFGGRNLNAVGVWWGEPGFDVLNGSRL